MERERVVNAFTCFISPIYRIPSCHCRGRPAPALSVLSLAEGSEAEGAVLNDLKIRHGFAT